MKWNIRFNPHDIWIGVYWEHGKHEGLEEWSFYICIIPMFPIHIWRLQ